MRFIKSTWTFFAGLLTVYGIFWLPKDLQDVSEAAEPWRRVLAMVDQTTALWTFAIVAVAYIGWIDARPFYRAWKDKKWPKEPTKPKLKLGSDIVTHNNGEGWIEVDCKVSNEGTPADVVADVLPVTSIFYNGFYKPVPAIWRHSSNRNFHLIRHQHNGFLCLNIHLKRRRVKIPHVGKDGKPESFEGMMRPVEDALEAVVKVRVISSPENVDGPLEMFLVVQIREQDNGYHMTAQMTSDLNHQLLFQTSFSP